MWEFRVKKSDRLDRLLRGEVFPGAEWLSRQAWDWLLDNCLVEVNGRKCSKSGVVVAEGSEVLVRFPAMPLELRKAEKAAELLWCDGSLVVFSKPCGMPTVPLFPWESNALANSAAAALEEKGFLPAAGFAALSTPPVLEGGLLQRLDSNTSGIVCAALNGNTKSLFRQLFSGSRIEKTYLAIVSGELDRARGDHQVWINSQGGPKVKASLVAPKAADEVSVLKVVFEKKAGNRALIRIRTSQGARHVVRAGMAALGAPLVGDELYGGEVCAPFHQLHALSLRLLDENAYPGFPADMEAPLPLSFLDSLRTLGLE